MHIQRHKWVPVFGMVFGEVVSEIWYYVCHIVELKMLQYVILVQLVFIHINQAAIKMNFVSLPFGQVKLQNCLPKST